MKHSRVIDAGTRRRLIERFGLRADEWCDALPTQLDRLTQKWRLRIWSTLSTGQTSCVALCRRLSDDHPVVLKISPERDLTLTEAAALIAWRPSGRLPQLFETDAQTGALLMEAIQPGMVLDRGRAIAYLDEIAELVSALREAPSEAVVAEFPPLIERVEFIFGLFRRRLGESRLASAVSPDLLDNSLEEARELANTASRQALLHGDLHPANVLHGGETRGLVAIDPRACRGNPAFDLIDWVLADAEDARTLMDRSERLAHRAGVEPEILWRWCICTAVLIAIANLLRERRLSSHSRVLLALAAEEI